MANTLSDTATVDGYWPTGTPITLRSFKVTNDGTAETGAACDIEVRDGDNAAMRWRIRYTGAANFSEQQTFPGTGVHCSGLSVNVGAATTHMTWQISYDNP